MISSDTQSQKPSKTYGFPWFFHGFSVSSLTPTQWSLLQLRSIFISTGTGTRTRATVFVILFRIRQREVVRGWCLDPNHWDAGNCHEKSDRGPGAKQFGASCLIVLCVFCLVYYCLLRFTNNDFFWPNSPYVLQVLQVPISCWNIHVGHRKTNHFQELTETVCPTELLTLDAPVTYKYTPTGNGALLDRTGTQRELGDPRNGYRMGLSQNWTIQLGFGAKRSYWDVNRGWFNLETEKRHVQ